MPWGIAPLYIREHWARRGRKVSRVEKNLGDLAQSRLCDLSATFGTRRELKYDRLWHVTGSAYIELQALEASDADMYLVFAGKGYVVPNSASKEASSRQTAWAADGDNDRSLGLLLPLETLEDISEEAIVL